MITVHTREERAARLFPEALHQFDLRDALAELRGEALYHQHGRNGATLVKNSELRVVLQAMQRGAHLAEHHAPGPITVQVLEGEIRFNVGETPHRLRAGDLLVVPALEPHSVEAVEDAAFLLTIAPRAG